MPPKRAWSTNRDQILWGGEDTLACQIPSHSSHALSRKCRETPDLTCFKLRKLNRRWPKSNHMWKCSGYISMQILGHSSHVFYINVRNPKIWTMSLSQNASKIRPKYNLVVRIHQHAKSQALPPWVLQKMSNNHKFDPFHYFFGLCDFEMWHMTLKI